MAEAQPKKKYKPMTTPVGVASWPKLTVPDPTYKKFSIGLRFPVDEGMAFLEQFKGMDAENLAEAQEKVKGKKDPKTLKPIEVVHQGLPYKLEADKTTGEPTGFMTIQFSTKESWTDKNKVVHPTKLVLKDSKANDLPASVQVGGGSKVKVAFVPSPYYIDGTRAAGVTFRLIGVQVIELNTGGYDNLFGEEEGGFVAPDEVEATPTETTQQDEANAKKPGKGQF